MSEQTSDRLKMTAKISSVVLTLAQIAAAVYLIAIDRSEHVPTIFLVVALACGSAGTAGLPSMLDFFSRSSSAPKKRRMPPPLPIFLIGVLLVVAIAVPGCIPVTAVGRDVLDRTSRASAHIDRSLADSRRTTSAEIRGRANATRDEHRRAMRPYDRALEVTLDVESAVLATERAIDGVEAGEAEDWMGLTACVLASFAELVSIAARRVDIPDDAGDVLMTLGSLARGACPLPDREEREAEPDAASEGAADPGVISSDPGGAE